MILAFPGAFGVVAPGTVWPEAGRSAFRRPLDAPFTVENPYTRAKSELGRMLFFDPALSGPGTKSCASCHNPALSYGDGLAVEVGVGARTTGARSPTLLDVAWIEVAGWDGHFASIDDVTLGAMANPNIMGADVDAVLARLAATPGYRTAFAEAFPGRAIDRATLRDAIAVYVRTIVSGPAPFDRWVDNDESAISDSAKRGFALFDGRAGCSGCHGGWSFTDGSFHDIGVAGDDVPGRGALFPTSVKLQHAFKVPTLRDVARRGPYMHDGSYPDLGAVLDLYDRGGTDRPSLSEQIHPLNLAPGERDDLLAFLDTLTSDPAPVAVPVVPRP
ncbi:MAG: cytochrome-c peroxidase [Janthinobacterium lividum]